MLDPQRRAEVQAWARRVVQHGVGRPEPNALLHFEWQWEDLALAAFHEVGAAFGDTTDVLSFADGSSTLVERDIADPDHDAAVAELVGWLREVWLAERGTSPFRKAVAHVHDTFFYTDLDSGEKVRADALA